MEIQVSVLTTAYNHAPFIAQAIEGVLAQKTSFAFEMIVHDDASTDSTPRIIEEYAKRHPDIIKPILQQQNQFSQGNDVYSFMLPLARGKYIALCEGDDYWCDPCKLQKQVDYMENHPECSYCFCNAYRVDVQGNVIGQQSPVHQSRVFSDREIIAATPDNPLNFPATAGVLCRTKDLMDCPTDFKAGEVGDMPLRFMLMLKGNAYGFADLMCCYRIMTPGSWTERGARESKFNPVKASQRNQAFIDFYHRFDQIQTGSTTRRSCPISSGGSTWNMHAGQIGKPYGRCLIGSSTKKIPGNAAPSYISRRISRFCFNSTAVCVTGLKSSAESKRLTPLHPQ